MNCRQCGKELPKYYSTDICLECSRLNIKKLFAEDTELKKAFKESIEELKKPENMKPMVDNTVKFYNTLRNLKDGIS